MINTDKHHNFLDNAKAALHYLFNPFSFFLQTKNGQFSTLLTKVLLQVFELELLWSWQSKLSSNSYLSIRKPTSMMIFLKVSSDISIDVSLSYGS